MGNDTLNGGTGDDIYIFAAGDGQDTIYDTGGNDTLRLNGYTLADLGLQRSNNDLIIDFGDDDEITLQSYFSSNGYNKIEQIGFADDSVCALADLLAVTGSF